MISKKKFRKALFFTVSACTLFSIGLLFGLYSWEKKIYISWSPSYDRGLAGEEEKMLLSVSSDSVVSQLNGVIFENADSVEEDGLLTFYLGDVLIPDNQTQKYRFLCEVFSHVEFSFFALGMTLSGDPGIMIVQSPCRKTEDLRLGPFFIPKKEILAQPNEKVFKFEEIETYIRFYKAFVSLTPSWFLKTLRFFNLEEGKNEELIVQFNSKSGEPFEITLNQPEEKTELILKQRSP